MEWVRAGRLLTLHRLGPLAVSENRRSGGRLLPPAVAGLLEPSYRATGLQNERLGEIGNGLVRELRSAEVPVLRFKGAALVGSGVYPDPSARPMGDIDLLVPEERAGAAASILFELGFVPVRDWSPELLDWTDSLSFTPPGESTDGPTIHLHWRTDYVSPSSGTRRGRSPLWRRADYDAGIPAMSAHLVVLAEHVLGRLGWKTHFPGLVDVGRAVARMDSWEQFVRIARRRPCAPGVGLLLHQLAEETGAPVPQGVIRSLGGGRIWLRPAAPRIRLAQLVNRRLAEDSRLVGVLLRGAFAGSFLGAAEQAAEALWPDEPWLRARYRDAHSRLAILRARHVSAVTRWVAGAS